MADPKGFLKYTREGPTRRPVELRVLDWKEMYEPDSDDKLQPQGAAVWTVACRFVKAPMDAPS